MNRRKKCRFRRSVLSTATALAMVISSMAVPQGAITAYAESEDDIPQEEGGGSGSSESLIKAVVDNSSPYSPTQISNGNFETEPWESFVLNGVTYTAVNTSVSGTIESSIPNGVGEGWNTTEKMPYKGNLFEVWPTNNPLDKQENGRDFTGNGGYFIEMNTNNPACLYQDMATQGGDVIKWTLQHAARNNLGFQEQRMYVTIGAPERENGKIVAATGVGVVNTSNNSIDDQIKTNIKSEGKAEYRYSNENQVSGNTAYANPEELAGLSVMKTDKTWHDATGIYVVPDGQEVTRFAFCADATSSKEGDNAKDLSGGNFLDNITFSTLVGNLKATKVSAEESGTTDKIKVTGYWGDTDANNHLIVEVGATKNCIDMSAVSNNNFVVKVPVTTTEGNKEIKVYHEKYVGAAKTVKVSHVHPWQYEVGNGETANQLSAYCTNNTDKENCVAAGKENKKTLTLQALNAEYTGKPYVGASFENAQKTDWIAAGLDVPKIQYQGTGSTSYEVSSNAPTNVGTYEAMITGGAVTAKAAFKITQKSIAAGGITITMKDSSYPYDGNPKTPVITVKDGYQTLKNGVDYKLSGTLTASQVSGDSGYTITVEGQGNYEGTITKTWKIKKGVMTDLQEKNYNGVYDGKPHRATVTVATPADANITYCDTEDGTYIADAPVYTDVGNYTIYYRIEKAGYESLSGTLTVSISSKPQHQITLETDSHGTASASVEGAVVTTAESGKEVTLTATPNSGYKFKKWTVSPDGPVIAGNKFTMPDTNVTIKAEFETAQSGSDGGSGGSGSGNSGSGSSGSNPSTQTPDTPDNASENFVIPVKNENTVKVEAEIKSGTAKVSEITTDTIDKVVENTEQESKVDTITIDLSGAKQEITGVTLSKKSVETLAKATADGDNGIETATIELSKATVVLDNKTLETLVADAKGILIELVVTDKEQKLLNTVQQTSLNQHEVATTFEAYFTSDGERIHDFKGGKAVVSIDFTPEAGKDTSFYHLVYVPEDGNLFRYKTKYENGKLMFTTTHFSDYAVIYDTNEKNLTEETTDGEEKKDSDIGEGKDADKDAEEKTDTKVTMDTSYSRLRLRIPKSTKTTNVLKWTRESGADGYVIYGNQCNTSQHIYKMEQKVVIPNGATTTWTDKKLQKATYYKYYIKAYKLVDGKKVWLAKSKVVHSTTTGGKYGNAKAVKVNKTAASLAVGKTFTIKAEQILKDLPILKHTEIQFESSNSKVASVNRKGIIKAKKKGTCTIYVYAQNGIYKKLKVTVK